MKESVAYTGPDPAVVDDSEDSASLWGARLPLLSPTVRCMLSSAVSSPLHSLSRLFALISFTPRSSLRPSRSVLSRYASFSPLSSLKLPLAYFPIIFFNQPPLLLLLQPQRLADSLQITGDLTWGLYSHLPSLVKAFYCLTGWLIFSLHWALWGVTACDLNQAFLWQYLSFIWTLPDDKSMSKHLNSLIAISTQWHLNIL